jgi:FMN phosphatase YigB (HAD superfamily)
MIRAVIFDCFGVLAGDAMPGFVERHFGRDAARSAEAWRCDDRLNLGEITMGEHIQQLANLAGIPAERVAEELDGDTVNQPLLDYIRDSLKPHYKLAILSNIHADILDELIGKQNRALFDIEALSYRLGVVKPTHEIYQVAARLLEVTPEECIFIDDKRRYCDAAEAVGMKTVQYTNLPQVVRGIEELLQ